MNPGRSGPYRPALFLSLLRFGPQQSSFLREGKYPPRHWLRSLQPSAGGDYPAHHWPLSFRSGNLHQSFSSNIFPVIREPLLSDSVSNGC